MSFSFPHFDRYPEISYGFSRRSDGSMNRHHEKENRSRYFSRLGFDPGQVATADLVHGSTALAVDEAAGGEMIHGADALVTGRRRLLLSATAADCFLVYFFNLRKRVAGIAHAGWRGLLAGVIPNTLALMSSHYGAGPADTLVGIGPGIRHCHFEISGKDRSKFSVYPEAIISREGKIFIDLPLIMKDQLIGAGVPDENIVQDEDCTYCEESEYFSYRRDKPPTVQPMVGYIGLTSK